MCERKEKGKVQTINKTDLKTGLTRSRIALHRCGLKNRPIPQTDQSKMESEPEKTVNTWGTCPKKGKTEEGKILFTKKKGEEQSKTNASQDMEKKKKKTI